MNGTELLFLIMLLIFLQPVVKQKWQQFGRLRLIAKIQRRRKSRVILMVHRQETMAILGFPLFRYIDINDAEEVLHAMRMTDPETPIDLVLHTPGGMVLASLQIARAVKKHPGPVRVIVPFYAMSGGTLIALAADEIVMSDHAVLGPVDPQLGFYPAASLVKTVARKPIERINDRTLIQADQAEKALAQLHESLLELFEGKHPPEKADDLARLLSQGKWTHDFPITLEYARELGMKVSPDMPPEFLKLMRRFAQPTRRRPHVEYLPEPYPQRDSQNGED